MGTIPDAAAHMSAAHHRARHRKSRRGGAPVKGRADMLGRFVVGAVVLVALIGGANALMLSLLK